MKFILTLILVLHVSISVYAQEDSTSIPTDEYYKVANSDDIYPLVTLLNMGYSYEQITSATEKGKMIKYVGKEQVLNAKGWIYATESTTNDRWFVRTEFVSNSYGEIKLWVKMKSKALTVKKKVYKDAYRKVLMYFKCKEKETKTVKIVFYTKEGELIDQFDSPYSDYDAIIPDSVMEDVIKTVEFLFD